MSTPTVDRPAEALQTSIPDAEAESDFDPFNLDIKFIENTPAAETVLMCSTGDTCGSSCPSACTTS